MRLFFLLKYPSYCLKWIASGRLHVSPIRRVVAFQQKAKKSGTTHMFKHLKNVGSFLGRKWLLGHFAWMPPKVAMLLCPSDFQQIQTINQEGTSISVKHPTSKQQNTNTTEESCQQILTSENPVVSSSESVHRLKIGAAKVQVFDWQVGFQVQGSYIEPHPAGGIPRRC